MEEKPPRTLRKSKDKVIAGVCGGIAEWLGWDKTVDRVG
jgi:phage shock protein PspC (stress-responsive transcriptional regulator)